MVKRVDGIFVPVVTPFDSENQSVGTEMLEYNIERLNHTDISGYMPLGSNGESFMMTDDECCRVKNFLRSIFSMKMRWIVIQETQSYNYSEKFAYCWHIFLFSNI